MNVLTSNAQTTWVKDGKNNNSFKGVTDLIQLKKDSTYLLTCSYRFTYLLKLDSLGNIIKNMPITETNNYVSLANGIVEVNNKIYGIGDISGFGLWYNNLYIRATDEQSNNFWHHDIGDSINYNSTRKIKYKNNILHVLSVKNLDNLPTPSIINITKLDTNGIIVFSKDIPTDTIYKFEANAYDFEILSDSSYIIFAEKRRKLGQLNPWFIKADKNGDTLFSKFHELPPNKKRGAFFSSVLLNDSSIIVVGENSDSANITKYDQNGKIIWERNYYSTPNNNRGFVSVNTTYDNNLIACGYKYKNGLGGNNKNSYINLVKLDTTGNIIWEKDYNHTEFNNYAFKISPTFDGGYIMIGGYSDSSNTFSSYAIVIKLDSLGNYNFATTINPVNKTTESISLYPNPTNAIIYIQALHPEEIKTITLYNINGSLINTYPYDSKSIDLSEYANGNYYLKIQYQNSFETKKIIKL